MERLEIEQEEKDASENQDIDELQQALAVYHNSRGLETNDFFSIRSPQLYDAHPDIIARVIQSHYENQGYVCTDNKWGDEMVFEKDGKRYLAIHEQHTDEINFRFRGMAR